jgi:flagellar biosynthesis/type III secretory pathway protein FliH
MGDLPAALQAKWKKQHEEDAEKAFAAASEDGYQAAVAPSFFKIAEQPETVMAMKRN